VPSLDTRLAARLGLRDDVVRLPLFGLGCAGGAGGLARMHDHLTARPDEVGVLLAVEICSLTTQRGDASVPHLVASALFGDGAAAVVAVGEAHPLAAACHPRSPHVSSPRIVATASRLYPGTERAMGWDIGSWGLRIVLDADVPALVETHLRSDVEDFLHRHDLKLDDIETWICHPGGPKVLEAVETSLGLSREAVQLTWNSLAEIGNLSSASVLHVLHDTLHGSAHDTLHDDRHEGRGERRPRDGSYGLLLSMGPGFAAELVLLRW
jgi:alkylresorcinol/alkylpyrone synthase